MIKEQLSVVICGALLFVIPPSVFAAPRASDISVRTIYFADGTSQSTATVQGPAGPQGPMGPEGPAGQMGATGQQGPAGNNGYNSLLLITDEISGSNCANGGIKIQTGLDQDRSGVLDSCEVLQTKYVCYGTTSVTPPLAPITVTPSPSTQTVNSFVNITATVAPASGSGNVYFSTTGSCRFYDPYLGFTSFASQYLSLGGIASVALTNSSSGPCTVIADYYDNNKQSYLSGSAVATFVPESSTTPVTPPPAPVTVTASPSTQTVNSFVNITATVTPASGNGNVYFSTTGSCRFYDPNLGYTSFASAYLSLGGIASVALTNSSSSPCIVYADYYDNNKQAYFSGSALATFVP